MEWVCDSWAIERNHRGTWTVYFGDETLVVANGSYANRRRAKKEITHYIMKGLIKAHHGAMKKPYAPQDT